jgi:type III secretion protein C
MIMKYLKLYSCLLAPLYLSLGSYLGSDEPYSSIESYKIDNISNPEYLSPPFQSRPSSPPLPTNSPPEKTQELIVQSFPPANPEEINHGISINFNNVSIVEYIRFVSKISGKNFVFNEDELKFNVTIISEESTSIKNMMAALIQELRIRDFSLIEQNNNIIIHRNPRVKAPSQIVAEGIENDGTSADIITRVFRLNTLDPIRAAEIIRPLLSADAQVEVLKDSSNLIITDLAVTIAKISQLIESLDAPIGGMTIGQYHIKNSFIEGLVILADKILSPIAQGNPYVLVPHVASNSIYIVSNPFIVERAITILQQIDTNNGQTKILTMEGLKFEQGLGTPPIPRAGEPINPSISPTITSQSIAAPAFIPFPSSGNQALAPIFTPPSTLNPEIANNPENFEPSILTNSSQWIQNLPTGHIQRTVFFIHKLKYRQGDEIEIALRKIANTLSVSKSSNQDLIDTIESTQWLESSNSLIFAGTPFALDKIRDLIDEIDVPLRQVFIEMLILDTTLNDSLAFGVDWGSRFGGGNTAGAQGFFSPNNDGGVFINPLNNASHPGVAGPDANSLASTPGLFQWGIIGQNLTMGGMTFNTIGALVTAIHGNNKTNILLNPKIITEDNNPAEIFVGETDQYRTQSIANDEGRTITNNFQLIDIGTLLRVTPLIGNNGIITLDIIEETTESIANNETSNVILQNPNGTVLAPLFRKNRTTTRVHVPDGFFVVISGQIRNIKSRTENRIPCLGGVPILGVMGKNKNDSERQRNLMLFIRPVIVDTACALEELTRREQNSYREKCKFKRAWNYEFDEGLDFLNIKRTDRDEQPACGV